MTTDPTWASEAATTNANQPLIDVCIVFAVLETLFVVAFMMSWHLNKDINSNNTKAVYAFILVGYVFCFGGVVIGILKIVIGGAGQHAQTLQPTTVRHMLQLVKAHEVVYALSIPFPKLALLCLYLRLFVAKLSTSILYIAGFVVVASALFGVIAAFSNCRPLYAFWDQTLHAQCTMDVMTLLRFYSVPNIATDVVMLILPIPALYRLNVSMLAKAGVAVTLLISTLGIVTAVLRFVAFLRVDIFRDITYLCISPTSWSIIEPGVYLIAATVPTLRPLIRQLVSPQDSGPVSRGTASQSCPSMQPTLLSTPTVDRPRPNKKPSTRDIIEFETLETLPRRPSRAMRLDDHHLLRHGSGAFSVRSDDEVSMVCADAVVHETMGRQGRNPDGTLRAWSLHPIQTSPLRTSFFLDGWSRSSSPAQR